MINFDGALEMEKGIQPLDEMMTKLNLRSHDLVEKSTEQLSHKVVAKARKGRKLTQKSKFKILDALNACQSHQKFALKDIFNY